MVTTIGQPQTGPPVRLDFDGELAPIGAVESPGFASFKASVLNLRPRSISSQTVFFFLDDTMVVSAETGPIPREGEVTVTAIVPARDLISQVGNGSFIARADLALNVTDDAIEGGSVSVFDTTPPDFVGGIFATECSIPEQVEPLTETTATVDVRNEPGGTWQTTVQLQNLDGTTLGGTTTDLSQGITPVDMTIVLPEEGLFFPVAIVTDANKISDDDDGFDPIPTP